MLHKEGREQKVGRPVMVPADDQILGSVAKNLASRYTILSTNCLWFWQIFIFSEHPSLLSLWWFHRMMYCLAGTEPNEKTLPRCWSKIKKKKRLWKHLCPLCACWSYSRWRISENCQAIPLHKDPHSTLPSIPWESSYRAVEPQWLPRLTMPFWLLCFLPDLLLWRMGRLLLVCYLAGEGDRWVV